jgi:MFS family permease
MGRAPGRATFGSVLANREFRALWTAELLSVAGDQLARVALAVLVFTRTNSAGLTGLTYALTFVPAFLGGVFLGGLGDRYPRRDVMVASDVVRAGLVAVMAIPGLPLAVLCVLVAVMTCLAGPFKSSQQALLPAVFAGDQTRYKVGQSLRTTTTQTAQLASFAGGGLLVAAINPSVGLLLDAGSFLISAVVVLLGVDSRPAVASGTALTLRALMAFARFVWRDPVLRGALVLSWLVGLYIAPEALAAPYAATLGLGAGAVGLLMAADPAGSAFGGFAWGTWVPDAVRARAAGWLAVLGGLPLVLCLFQPGLLVAMILFAGTGMAATACIIETNALYTLRAPDTNRAAAAGLFSAGLLSSQGLGALGAGLLAEWIGPVAAVVVAGALGAVLAVPIAITWTRAPD